jgi:hypothetical protein
MLSYIRLEIAHNFDTADGSVFQKYKQVNIVNL